MTDVQLKAALVDLILLGWTGDGALEYVALALGAARTPFFLRWQFGRPN